MTPRASDDASKFKLSVRDVLILLAGGLAMYGAQLGVQWRTQAAIEQLGTKFDGYVQKQENTNAALQRQIDEWRAETKLNRERMNDTERTLAEIKGVLTGSAMKGAPK
jgi:hypothetical protein